MAPRSKTSPGHALNELRARTRRLVLDGLPGEAMFAWMQFMQDVVPTLPESEQVRAQAQFDELVELIDPGDEDAPSGSNQ